MPSADLILLVPDILLAAPSPTRDVNARRTLFWLWFVWFLDLAVHGEQTVHCGQQEHSSLARRVASTGAVSPVASRNPPAKGRTRSNAASSAPSALHPTQCSPGCATCEAVKFAKAALGGGVSRRTGGGRGGGRVAECARGAGKAGAGSPIAAVRGNWGNRGGQARVGEALALSRQCSARDFSPRRTPCAWLGGAGQSRGV